MGLWRSLPYLGRTCPRCSLVPLPEITFTHVLPELDSKLHHVYVQGPWGNVPAPQY